MEENNEILNTEDPQSEGLPVTKKEIKLNNELLLKLLDSIKSIDFKEKVYPEYLELKEKLLTEKDSAKIATLQKRMSSFNLGKKHYLVTIIDEILNIAKVNNWGICRKDDFFYLYNGSYWQLLEKEELETFLGKAAEKMGADKYDAQYYMFRDGLLKQFCSTASLPNPNAENTEVVINLSNGTYRIDASGGRLTRFNQDDFLKYLLPFEYNPTTKAPMFQQYLDEVLADRDCQMILAEFLAYVFTPHLKLEKTLLLYGSGANGKSVFFEIVTALLGNVNVTNYSLQSLTQANGYNRAKLSNTLVNYASELSGKLDTNVFKQLVSAEPVEARLPYGQPFIMRRYGRLIFNCNQLPRSVEHTNAFFRRFLIVPFNQTIPPEKQDKELSQKIIDSELSGIFNWVLEGLNRILTQKAFTKSASVEKELERYKHDADTVHLFLDDSNLEKSSVNHINLKSLYEKYSEYCKESGFNRLNSKNFRKRLVSPNIKVEIKRRSHGYIVFLQERKVQQILSLITRSNNTSN